MSRSNEDRLEATSAFEAGADLILQQFHAAKGRTANSPFDSRWGTFKRNAYDLIRRTKGLEGRHNVIKGLVRRFEAEPARLAYKGNEFHFGLLAIDPEGEAIDARRVSLFARQMTYADLHEIEPWQLIGFLYQSGPSTDIAKKLVQGAREPWFGTSRFRRGASPKTG